MNLKAQAESMPVAMELEQLLPVSETPVIYGTAQVGNMPVHYRVAIGGDRFIGIVPGLFGAEGMLDPLADSMAALGYTALTYGQARKGARFINDLCRPQLLHTDTLTAVLDDAAKNPDLPAIDLTKIDLAAHSMGTHPAFAYGIKHPDEVRSEIAIAPCGIERHFASRLVKRLPKFEKQVADMAVRYMHNAEKLHRVTKHTLDNVPLLAGELMSCLMSTENYRRAQALGELGVAVAIVGGANDQVTHPHGLQESAGQLGVPFRLLSNPRAEHDAVMQYHVDVAGTIAAIHAALDTAPRLQLT